MKIYCLGDIACPDTYHIDKLKQKIMNIDIPKDGIILGNLEGLLVENEKNLHLKFTNSLFNNVEILKIFKKYQKVLFTIANNHTEDIPQNFNYTLSKLKKHGILFVGASTQKEKAASPIEYEHNGEKIAVFGHCWDVMTKITHKHKNNIYINSSKYDELIKTIKNYKINNPKTSVIVYFHWNFDFEKLPFPQHLYISRKLIDSGVDLVIGSHSHIINGYELYKNKCIVYGLGNFYIPSNYFYNKKLTYPKECDKSILVKYDTNTKKSQLYSVDKNGKTENIAMNKKESVVDNNYSNIELSDYNKYFRKNRRKNTFVPVFRNCNLIDLYLKETIILFRIKVARLLKGWR